MLTVTGVAASRKRIAPFRLFRPSSVEAACDLLVRWPDAVLHAGGIDLVNRMKGGLAADAVIALNDVAELKGIRRVGNVIEIGAAVSHWQIEHDDLLKSCLPYIPEYVAGLGNVRVRMQGTIGGNVMADDPGYEILPLLAVLGAELHFVDWKACSRSAVAARAWSGKLQAAGRILSTIAIPLRPITVAWRRDLRPLLGLVASLEWEGGHAVSGLGGLSGQGPVWHPIPLDRPVSGQEISAQAYLVAERWKAQLTDFGVRDGRTDDYYQHVAGVMMKRALQEMAAP